NAEGPVHPPVRMRACMIVTWKWQRPEHRQRNEGGGNIEQLCVWNTPDDRLPELGTDKKKVAMDDSMVEPFKENEDASHRDQSNSGGNEHLLPQHRCVMVRLPRRVSISEII